MFHMLIPWGVMTSHIKSRGGKFIEGQQTLYWSLEQFMKNIEGREISHINILSWTSFVIVSTH